MGLRHLNRFFGQNITAPLGFSNSVAAQSNQEGDHDAAAVR